MSTRKSKRKAGPNDEERGQPQVPAPMPEARSSSSVSLLGVSSRLCH